MIMLAVACCAVVLVPAFAPPSVHIAPARRLSRPVASTANSIADNLANELAAVRALRPSDQSPKVQASLWEAAGLNPAFKLSGVVTGEPSFTRLFDHASWSAYTGVTPSRRWWRTLVTWRHSTILASVMRICLLMGAWAFVVASMPAQFLPRTSPLPLSLMGSAIGLLLVFRTNNTYLRLAEARLLWGRAVYLCREVCHSLPSHTQCAVVPYVV